MRSGGFWGAPVVRWSGGGEELGFSDCVDVPGGRGVGHGGSGFQRRQCG